jgi:hypothetical protein
LGRLLLEADFRASQKSLASGPTPPRPKGITIRFLKREEKKFPFFSSRFKNLIKGGSLTRKIRDASEKAAAGCQSGERKVDFPPK